MNLPSGLPPASPEALGHSLRLCELIAGEIRSAGGWIDFDRYMELALYSPGLGYYAAGSRKLGADGDFTTAPEISPLFGQCLARQAAQVLEQGFTEILEVGAGSGALAATLLEELERLQRLPERYLILELSPDLRERSRDTLARRVPHLLERVAWLNVLPPAFSGLILGNEVLDAMPVNVYEHDAHGPERTADTVIEMGVTTTNGAEVGSDDKPACGFAWAPAPASRQAALPEGVDPEWFCGPGYRSEVQLVAQGFVRSIGAMLERGAAIFIDYGFPRAEYYHPQRAQGTLMCHYRHRAHADPFFLPGLQDITSHVDFTAMAWAAHHAGMEVLGYTSQATFLVNCGITELLARVGPDDTARYLPLTNQANRLLSPAEMGELFKAIAFGRGLDTPLVGFGNGGRSHTL